VGGVIRSVVARRVAMTRCRRWCALQWIGRRGRGIVSSLEYLRFGARIFGAPVMSVTSCSARSSGHLLTGSIVAFGKLQGSSPSARDLSAAEAGHFLLFSRSSPSEDGSS